jgi:RND superfamily putative drug exporter
MFATLTRWTTTHPRRILLGAVAIFALGGAFGGPVAGLLNADNDSFSDTGSESFRALENVESASGLRATNDVLVIVPLSDEKALAKVPAILKSEAAVGRVVGGPQSGPAFVSQDGRHTFFAATYREGADADVTTTALRDKLDEVPGIKVGGEGVAYQEVNATVESDLLRAEMLAFPLLFLVSLLVFRSAVAALLPLLVGGLTIVTALSMLRGVNELLDISTFALNLITGLGLGLAIDYSLFMVSRFREELARLGDDRKREALGRTIATAGRTVLFSALTVAGAGLALLVFPLRFLYSMGIGVTLVSLAAAAVSLLVLPALFMVLGPNVNALSLKRWRRAAEAEARADTVGFWYRLSQFVMRRPIPVALVGAAILLGLGAPFLGIKFTGVDATVLPDSAVSKQVFLSLRADFPQATAAPFILAIDAPASAKAAVADYARDVAAVPGVENALDPQYLGHNTWEIVADPTNEPLAESSLKAVDLIRALPTPGHVQLGGIAADEIDQISALVRNLPLAIAIIAILTIVTLFLMTGSVILPIKALVMNVLTVSATFGILVWIFQDGRFQGLLHYTPREGLESSNKVFMFAVIFGLSTDYAVFLLTRIKEARDAGAGERPSVALGLQRTGRIVTAAAVLFAIALGSFATSGIVFMKEMGLGTALAVLIDATIVRALLVPSLMALLGRWNWWAPAPLRRLHDRFGISDAGHDPELVSVG